MSVIPKILFVDDDELDINLLKRGFQKAAIQCEIEVAATGTEALEILQSQNQHPDVILLDINIPKKNGFEVLAEIRKNPLFRFLPVIVVTGSHREEDLRRAYDLGANAVISKSVSYSDTRKLAEGIAAFWFQNSLAEILSSGS